MIYIPQYFKLWELIPKEFYEKHKRLGVRLWLMFDPKVLWTADQIRKRYGTMQANTWKRGGVHQFRGWRPMDCKWGSAISQHKFGRGIDLKPVKVTAQEIRNDIKADPLNEIFQYITCIESKISWFHFDTRNWAKTDSGLLIVYP